MRWHIRALAALVLVACGGSNAGSSPPSKASNDKKNDGVVRQITQAQLEVAHYASGDKMFGLVLDRTGGGFKVRVDGEKDVIQLTPEEDRHFGERRGWYLVKPDGKRLMYLWSYGALTLYKGQDEIELNSDKPADPLPAPTIAGAPKKEKTASDVLIEQLRAIAVRTKMPEVTQADASDLGKVNGVLDRADKSMVARYVEPKPSQWKARLEWTKESGVTFGGGAWETEQAWTKSGAGLAKYGAIVKGYSEYDSRGNHLFVQHMKGYPPELLGGTPGLVWEVDSTQAVFVAFDGGRYVIDVGYQNVQDGAPLEIVAPPGAQWPAPLQHALLDVTDVTALAKTGAVPKKVAEDVLAADEAWNTCAQKTWKGAKREVDTLEATDMNWSTRAGRKKQLFEKYENVARAQCKASAERLEKLLTDAIEARNKDRLGLYEKAKAKFP